MAVLHKYVMGTFTNKVGGVVGSSWKGIPVIRSMPASVANPQSAAQMTQRMRFSLMVYFASLILTGWIRPLWNRGAKRMSGFNAFVRANMNAFNLDGNIVLSEVVASRGRLQRPMLVETTIGATDITVAVRHPLVDKYATVNDEIYLIVFNYTTQQLIFAGATGVVRGNSATSAVTIPDVATPNMAIFAAYRHPRGIFISDSQVEITGSGDAVVVPTSDFLFAFAKKMRIDTSNIDSTIDEAGAIAVLKEAIKEKTAMKDVTVRSQGVIDALDCPDNAEYNPEPEEIDVDKFSEKETCANEEMKHFMVNRGKSTSKGSKR